mgnify:CR=1 FL=1
MVHGMKNVITATLCLILLVGGCAKKAEEGEKKIVFAFVPKLLDNPVFQTAWQGAQGAAKELGGGKIEVQRYAPVKSDAVEQAQIVESLIEKKVDGIAISVNDADALKESIDKAVDAKEAEHLMSGLNFGDAASQDIRGAVQYLKQGGSKVGVSGYCMGGALTILAAVFVPEVDAAVAWYGFPPLEYVDASKIKAPLMGHFAIHDGFFKIEQVDQLEQKLNAAGVPYTDRKSVV